MTKGASTTGECKKCDSECQTCTNNAITCLSCPPKFEMDGSRCVSVNKVTLKLVLNIPLSNLISVMDSLLSWIVDNINKNLAAGAVKVTRNKVIIRRAKSGSSAIEAVVSAGSADNANSVSSGLSAAISETPTIGGVALTGQVAAATEPTTTSTSSSNLGVILGIVIPLGILSNFLI